MTDTANPIKETLVGNSGDPLKPEQCYQPDTYYQILEVRPANKKKKRVNQNIFTTIVAKQKGTGEINESRKDTFDNYEVDENTREKLKPYYSQIKEENRKILSSYLPSPGIVFPDDFVKSLTKDGINSTLLNNFYDSLRGILISRKISQLIAKTWWAYLEAKKLDLWDKFTAGEWDYLYEKHTDILDGLIAREIFMFAGDDSPDSTESSNDDIYKILKEKDTDKNARFLILPSSKSWQGILMSLLLSGQAYYQIKGKYHQISQPIMSTGEIVIKYSFESDWSKFSGEIKELCTNLESPWVVSQVVIPYPPIPTETELDIKDIKTWAEAEDEGGELPFYKKRDDDYLMDAEYFRAPYPYIPLSTT